MHVNTLNLRLIYVDLQKKKKETNIKSYAVLEIRGKNQDSLQFLKEEHIDHLVTERRRNNDNTMALYYIHSTYCIHDTSDIVKYLYN